MPTLESIDYVVSAMWRVSWQASILVLLVLLAQGLIRQRLSPAWRSALWLLVVVRLLLPVTPSSSWSLFNLTDGLVPAPVSSSEPITMSDPTEWIEAAVTDWSSTSQGAWHEPASAWNRPALSKEALLSQEWPTPIAPFAAEPTGPHSSINWIAAVFWTWLAGVIGMGAWLAWGTATFARRLRRESAVRDPRTLALLDDCRAIMGTGAPLKLVETDQVDSPALFGFRRLILLLPTGTIRRLEPSELGHVFLHELAHMRRGDVLLNWLTTLLQVLHWFNPVIWFAFARMRADREMACDAMALDRGGSTDRAAYGATILKLVSGLNSARSAPGLVGISERKSNLKRRIRMIASHRNPRRGSFLAVMILMTLGLVSLTDARATREVEEPEGDRNGETVLLDSEHEESPPMVADRDPNPFATPALLRASDGDAIRAIQSKLHQIVLSEVLFDGIPLPDVLDYLHRASEADDPDGHGINFLINPAVVVSLWPDPLVDPTTGELIPPTPIEPIDMNSVRIRIVPPLRNVRLGDLLEVIVRVADKPIQYSIEDFGIVFSQKPPDESIELETRIFRLNPNTFLEALDAVGVLPRGDSIQSRTGDLAGGGGFAGSGGVFDLPRVFLQGRDAFGGPDGLPGVTSTNMTESAQARIRNFFLAAGINVMPPNQIYYNPRKGVLMVRATPREQDIIQQAIEVLNEPPPQVTLELVAVEITRGDATGPQLDRINGAGDERIVTGVLTESQFKVVLRELESRPGVRIFSAPRITTLSGRETVIGCGLPDGSPVRIELLPVVQANGYDIELPLRIRAGGTDLDESTGLLLPAPDPEERDLVTSTTAVVRDGQTVVVGGLRPEDFRSTAHLEHELQDHPVVGQLFRGTTTDTQGQLLLFITPTRIDPAGNRVPSADRLPDDAR